MYDTVAMFTFESQNFKYLKI